jgi:hypothetical protein
LKKSKDEIIEDKLSSNLRKSKARRDKAHEAVHEAEQAPDSNTRRGQSVIRQRMRAARKADASAALHSKAQLVHETNNALRQRTGPLRERFPRKI